MEPFGSLGTMEFPSTGYLWKWDPSAPLGYTWDQAAAEKAALDARTAQAKVFQGMGFVVRDFIKTDDEVTMCRFRLREEPLEVTVRNVLIYGLYIDKE